MSVNFHSPLPLPPQTHTHKSQLIISLLYRRSELSNDLINLLCDLSSRKWKEMLWIYNVTVTLQ